MTGKKNPHKTSLAGKQGKIAKEDGEGIREETTAKTPRKKD